MGWKHVVFGGGSSVSDWTLLRRPSPGGACAREVTGTDWGFVHVFETLRRTEMASYKDSVLELASSLTGCSSREPGSPRSRLDTPERGHRGLEPSKMKERQSRHRWSLENTLEDGPRSSPTVSSTVPGDARENVASFHLPPRTSTHDAVSRSMRRAQCSVNVKCFKSLNVDDVRCSSTYQIFKCIELLVSALMRWSLLLELS